ncbi:MAG TPA: alkaline phosphatase [bacterium]|nr:alkaline phosphatase [bacterium]
MVRFRTRAWSVLAAIAFISLCGFNPEDVVPDRCSLQKEAAADCSAFAADGAGTAKNVILIIGDGMGIGATYAGRVYQNGPDQPLDWEELPHRGLVTTCAIGMITDSAASGTAFATGHKTRIGEVSVSPGPEYKPYQSVLEFVKDRKATGLVTTTMIWDATPAVFAAHAPKRSSSKDIAAQMLEKTGVDVMLGGGAAAFKADATHPDLIAKAPDLGYKVVATAPELAKVDLTNTNKLLGLFADKSLEYEAERPAESTEPHLSDMAAVALDILDNDPRGFFIMIEGANIDHAGHSMDMDDLLGEMAEFDKTVDLVLAWAQEHPDTLIVITADHETGGIKVIPGEYNKGDKIEVKWTTAFLGLHASHSSQQVPIYAIGPNASAIKPHMDNTEIYCVLKNAFAP